MKITELQKVLDNQPKLYDYYESPDPHYAAVRKEVNEWFEKFLKLFSLFKVENVIISRKDLVKVLENVHDKPLKDFINSLLKTHFSEDS